MSGRLSRGAFRPGSTIDPNAVAAGEESIPRLVVIASTGALVSQQLHLTYFTAKKTETEASVKVRTGATAAAATPTLCRMGLYSVAANGDIALIASTPNDTTLFAAANTAYTKAYSVAAQRVAGTRYARGILVVSAAAMPTFFSSAISTPFGNELATAPRLAAQVTGQADLPASVAAGSLVNGSMAIYSVGLPT